MWWADFVDLLPAELQSQGASGRPLIGADRCLRILQRTAQAPNLEVSADAMFADEFIAGDKLRHRKGAAKLIRSGPVWVCG